MFGWRRRRDIQREYDEKKAEFERLRSMCVLDGAEFYDRKMELKELEEQLAEHGASAVDELDELLFFEDDWE